jgi:ketosteroid isomerase-like protein
MKQIIQRSLLLAIASITLLTGRLRAQDASKEIAVFAKKFQALYNAKDDKALKMMYTEDAVRVAQDGTTLTGNEAISAEFAKSFADIKPTIDIKQDKVTTQADGSAVATGTYHVKGTTAAGDSIDVTGGYTNTLVKIKGHWKLSRSVLAAL